MSLKSAKQISTLILLFLFSALVQAQSSHIVLLTSDFVLEGKLRQIQAAAEASGLSLDYLYAGQTETAEAAHALSDAALVIIDAPRGNDMASIQQHFAELLAEYPGPLLTVIGNTHRAQRLDQKHGEALGTYYRHGTAVNFNAMFRYWAVHVTGLASGSVPEPVTFPDQGIYHPDMPALVAETPQAYLHWRAEASRHTGPGIGVIMSRSQFTGDQTGVLDGLVRRMEARGAVPWVFYVESDAEDSITRMVTDDAGLHIDVLINMTHLRGVVDIPRELATLGLPMLQGFIYREGSVEDWQADTAGIPMRSVPAFIAIPEQMGVQDPVVIAALEQGEPVLIDTQVEHLLDRAMRIIRLRERPAQDKQLALMYWSYPPGERGVSASNLNVPRSLAALLPQLEDAGYAVRSVTSEYLEETLPFLLDPWQGRISLQEWTEQHPAAWDSVALEDYQHWFDTLPQATRSRISRHWGEASEDAMLMDTGKGPVFIVPRLQLGHLTLLPQPSRQPGGSSLASYHDGDTPPTHAYLATYLYLRKGLDSDALIHFGTHGTQEFLSGKERGLSVHDDAWLTLGDLPVIYPYITDNIGEALQAKRRGQAVTISHQTPPFAPAGLHGELLAVHDLLHEWQMLDDGAVRQQAESAILDSVTENDLYQDLGWSQEQIQSDFAAFQDALHLYLHALAADAQPLGLHVFGSYPQDEHRISTIMQMLGDELYASLLVDDDLDELFVDDYNALSDSLPYRFVADILSGRTSPEDLSAPAQRTLASQALDWQQAMLDNAEVAHLLKALKGEYIPTSTGGDPIRNPGILPTGRNLFGFDPSRLPTERAWSVGQALADDLIASHREQHGEYPESLALSLWSSEAMRQQGIMEAQMLHLLGLEPHWDRGGRLERIAIVPAETLGRPRVDVVASITGIYRDQFPLFIEHLSLALLELATLDEPGNPVSRHAGLLKETLMAGGVDEDRARQLSAVRVFSSGSGNYGTGVPDGIFDTEGWEEDGEIAEAYLQRMQYGYGAGDGMWGVRLDDLNLYSENLRRVQGAVLSRSSNLHGLLSTDHPFEYLGGIALAVRHLSGNTPDLYISNTRSSGGERNVSAAGFLAGELRSRYQHPGWISAMQNEGYAGTLELQNIVNNVFGWQVTDPSMIRDDQWQRFHDIYVDDSLGLGLREWFETHNSEALQRIIERMLEAVRRDYWQADEATLQNLIEQHQALGGKAAGKLGDFIDTLATGFGLDMAATASAQTVTGQRLTEVSENTASASPAPPWLPITALLLLLAGGALRQSLRSPRLTSSA